MRSSRVIVGVIWLVCQRSITAYVAYAQKVQRLKARIRSETNDETQGEPKSELYQIEEQGIENLSHTIWGGVLITILAAYESSIEELFAFVADKRSLPSLSGKEN